MKVLMVSRTFPMSHPRAGKPTGFVDKISSGEKIHTIRANAKGHFKDGDEVSLRYWSGKPYRSKQVEFARRVIHLQPIILQHPGKYYFIGVCGDILTFPRQIARNDGLSFDDFFSWFFLDGRYGEFRGDLLHFTDFRYSRGGPEGDYAS